MDLYHAILPTTAPYHYVPKPRYKSLYVSSSHPPLLGAKCASPESMAGKPALHDRVTKVHDQIVTTFMLHVHGRSRQPVRMGSNQMGRTWFRLTRSISRYCSSLLWSTCCTTLFSPARRATLSTTRTQAFLFVYVSRPPCHRRQTSTTYRATLGRVMVRKRVLVVSSRLGSTANLVFRTSVEPARH